MANQLVIPKEVVSDPNSVEMVRTWIAHGDMFVVLNIGFWEQPDRGIDEREAWGFLMADMARHIANAHVEEYDRDTRETLQIIAESFNREIKKPTSTHSGHFARHEPRDEQ